MPTKLETIARVLEGVPKFSKLENELDSKVDSIHLCHLDMRRYFLHRQGKSIVSPIFARMMLLVRIRGFASGG